MRKLLVALSLLLLAAGAMMMVGVSTEPAWTTASDEARTSFEEGLAARMKYYHPEAKELFERAVELDPEFAAAKLYLSFYEQDWERRQELRDELGGAPLDRLTARERFLVEFHSAMWDRDLERALEIGRSYVESHPRDPFGLSHLADLFWEEQDWEEAARLYRELLDIAPNWVTAQNRLGYIALAQGRFEEAEEHFKTYQYIAPDQANPHDSMGELLVLLGRYEEARRSFERALEIHPDFCSTYQHMLDLVVMQGDLELGETILQRAGAHCSERMVETLRCALLIWEDFLRGQAERVWQEERAECRRVMGEHNFLLHRTAATTGRLEIAEQAERELERRIDAAEEAHHVRLDFPRALLLHMRGTRMLTQGEYEAAVEAFREADDRLLYWGEGQGILKLYNQLNLAFAQEKLGRTEASERTLERIAAVNPRFAATYPNSVHM
ncbi:MAG: tetratricopeptide repeat protein [Thermoanaerobaculia bacterium]|nr:tetratricopeptide repeat protein [Thermoanaerobaculia bacterium]